MDLRAAPAVLPALALGAGALLASRLSYLPVGRLALVVLLGLALPRGWYRLIGWLALGVLWSAVFCWLPSREGGAFAPHRPVEVVVEPRGVWRWRSDGWLAQGRVERLRQGSRVETAPLQVWVSLPGSEPPPMASLLRLKGHLRRSRGFFNGGRVAPGPWRLQLKTRRFLAVERGPTWRQRFSHGLRQVVDAALHGQSAQSPGPALARALVLGETGRLPASWLQGLRRCGLAHLLAVSGLHVGLVAGLGYLAGFALPRRLRLAAMIATVLGYLALVGPRPSLLRASLMAAVAAGALLLQRPPQAANAIALSATLLLAEDPELVIDLGFQLTFSAAAGIIFLAPVLARRWSLLPRWLAQPLAATAAAQVLTIPWSVPAFHLVGPLAPVLNLVAIPWTALALAGSLAWTAAAVAAPRLGSWLLPLQELLATPFSWPGAAAPRWWWNLPLALPAGHAWILAGILCLTLMWPRRLLAPVSLLLALRLLLPQSGDAVELVMLDVGQGDALLLRDGNQTLLVDGGGWQRPGVGARVLLPALAAEGVRDLHAMVLTHPDRDHCAGLLELAGYLAVQEIWTAPGWLNGICVAELMTTPGVAMRVLWAGQEVQVGRWKLEVVHPQPGGRHGSNERSLVMVAAARGRRFLLTGDVDAAIERDLVRRDRGALRCEVLKVPHHGSKTSSTSGLLAAVDPKLALVSVGEGNPYGHPAPAVLQRLEERRVLILRTDQHGMIRVRVPAAGPLRVSTQTAPLLGEQL